MLLRHQAIWVMKETKDLLAICGKMFSFSRWNFLYYRNVFQAQFVNLIEDVWLLYGGQNKKVDGVGWPRQLAKIFSKFSSLDSPGKSSPHPCTFYDRAEEFAQKYVSFLACGSSSACERPKNGKIRSSHQGTERVRLGATGWTGAGTMYGEEQRAGISETSDNSHRP